MGMTTISDEHLAELALAAATLDCDEADEIVEALMELESRRKEEAERPKEWRIAWNWRDTGFTAGQSPVRNESEVDAHLLHRSGQSPALTVNLRKQWRYAASEWQDVEPQARSERES